MARFEDQRALLPESSYRRLRLNEWTSAEDRLTSVDALRECVTLDGLLRPAYGRDYVVAVDVGLKEGPDGRCRLSRRAPASLHFPVGGRRFRPSVEDFIEFLVQEDLCHPKQLWRGTIAQSRGDWEDRQVRATVRRAPDMASEQLRSMGYVVKPPKP